MLDKGHSLARVEMLNWGNFNGHHQAIFKNDSILPLHFNNSSSSAILGVNGSGKSSLIDGIMIALFPFENMLRLGVTNDSERGTGGGRSITDYVLGKFASTSGKEGKNLSQVYNRSSGASMLHITLQNNTSPHKYISAGIIWWYSGHQIQDRQFYIIHR